MKFKVIKINDLISYKNALDVQMEMFDLVQDKTIDGVLLILEHKPVLTMGIRTDENNLLVTPQYLNDQGIDLFKVDRGGDITFHGPGQIVAYPILRFRDFKLRLSEYMHKLEEVVIDTLKKYSIKAHRKSDFPGVWVNDTKICAIGVRAKKFIVYHGLAFNITTDKSYFNLINPCGITNYSISSMNDFITDIDIEQVKDDVIKSFETVFDVTFEQTTLEDIKKEGI